MKLFVNGVGCISPQFTYDNTVFLPQIKEYNTNRIRCVDPDYSVFFDAGSIRRMWHLLKFGTAAGILALKDAEIKTPGAITTGTGLGLPEVSQKFLRNLIESDETIVSPTTFIQSTHNTVSSNIALLCSCFGHNNTFSNRGFSFESALTDAQLICLESDEPILVGAYDEVSDYKYASLKKTNQVRTEPCSNLDIFSTSNPGIIAGEGAAFFVLAKEKTANTYCSFLANRFFYTPKTLEETKNIIVHFLEENHLSLDEIDVVISGLSGEKQNDEPYKLLNQSFFKTQTIAAYKHLCGEYMTSSAFAFWLAAKMIKHETVPDSVLIENRSRAVKTILVYTAHKANHSLMLLQKHNLE